jgi:pimeloyl-ACP methyl ester carboxylesterase
VEECWMDFDGVRMRYLRTKSPLLAKDARNGAAMPPVVLLHGLLGYSFSWRFTIPALAKCATVYAPDMLGAGFSDRPAGIDHSMRGTAQRVLRFVKQLGISSFDLVGTSHGGAVAMMVAAECGRGNAGPRLRRLVLVAPVNPFSAHGRRLAPFAGSNLGAALVGFGAAHMKFLFPYFHARLYAHRGNIPTGTLAGYVAPLAKPGLIEHALSIVGSWTEDLRQLEMNLPRLANVPTLLLWGSKDPAVYASSAVRLQKYFANSKLIVFPGVGHLPYEECPVEFNRAVIEFLAAGEAPE